MIRAIVAALALWAFARPAIAGEHWGTTKITSVAAVGDDQLYPQYSRTIYVGFADASWLPKKCLKFPGLLARDDQSALFSLAQLALVNGNKVNIKASDGMMIGDYCTVFQITVHSAEPAAAK